MGHTKGQVIAALEKAGGSVTEAAQALGTSRQAVYRMMEAYGIPRTGHSGHSGHVRLSETSDVRLRDEPAAPNFSANMATAVETPGRRSTRTISILPEHFEALRKGRRELSYHLQTDFTDAAVHGMFFEDMFQYWLERKRRGLPAVSGQAEPELDLDDVVPGPGKNGKE